MKSVAIIGAGPSGLVAAKKCLLMYPGTFHVSLFEKQNRVGGLWAVDPSDQSKMVNPLMPTNISKYSVSFSDFSWESVKLSTEDRDSQNGPTIIPEFPKAWMVGQYLDQYRQKYIPSESLRLNCKVTDVSKVDTDYGTSKWRVQWIQSLTDSAGPVDHEELFDYVIVSTGFFSKPIPVAPSNTTPSNLENAARIIHSSQCRNLADLTPKDWSGSGDILVYGGSMSGVEVAASIAYQISSKKHSPSVESFGSPKVYHVTARPFYVFTPYAPTDLSQKSPSFLPIDLAVFDLSGRPLETAVASYGRMASETAQSFHGLFRLQIGGDQGDLNTVLTASSTNDAPYFANATGASYVEFVRSGDIVPISGRVEALESSNKSLDHTQTLDVILSQSQSQGYSSIKNIVAAVHATGFKPDLDFLSDDVKNRLDYDDANHRLPMALTNAQTMNPNVADIAFIGIHEGSFWGSEESQARMIVKTWVEEGPNTKPKLNEDSETTQDLRVGISNRSRNIPQYLYGDFVGHMEQAALHEYATRDDGPWNGRKGPAIPARYTDRSDDLNEVKLTIDKLQDMMTKASTKGLFVAKTAFIGFQGKWHIHREIKSALKTSPSGTFFGTANFYPRQSTNIEYDREYLYVEDGDFKTDEGFSMKASRRYTYRYQQDTDQLTTWFIKPDGKTVDYLFLDLVIRRASDENDFWIGTGHHPCKPDIYDSKYTFQFRGMALEKFIVEYKVIGPHKDYISTSTYKR